MQPPRRSRRSTRSYSSLAAEEPCSSRGWLSARRKPSKRARPIADGGTPLSDEILVGIFAGLPDLADLVRCAGTCRRWRRLVSAEAAFICRASRRRTTARGFFLRGLALGFFHTHRRGAAPRFAPTASASRRLGLRQPTSLNALVDGLDDGLFDSSRLVASRNGLLVVELRHNRHVLKLCVCNPMTGEVTVLPPLTGKDSLGDYACTVLTADATTDQTRSSWYRLLIVYRRQTFAACRSYSSDDDGAWGPEARVIMGSVPTASQMTTMTGTGVALGNTVYWHTKNQVFVLCLDFDPPMAYFKDMPRSKHDPVGNAMLGVSPDGRLRALQIMVQVTFPSVTVTERGAAISVSTMGAADFKWEPDQEVIPVAQWLPAEATHVRLRWVCEKSGVVFFSAGCDDRTSDMYALNLDKKEVEMVASHQHGGRDPSLWCNLHGYEMNLTLYLSSLGMDEDYS